MRSDEHLDAICEMLHLNCGDIHDAARQAGVSPAFVFNWIKDDKVAAERIEEAKRVGYAGLESEAVRRAVRGVEQEIYYKGEVVGYKTEYSDGLLSKLMEARLPEYSKKDGAGSVNFFGPTQINSMPRAETYEDWLKMRDTTLEAREQEALPAPTVPDILQGEYVEVEEERPLAALGGLL